MEAPHYYWAVKITPINIKKVIEYLNFKNDKVIITLEACGYSKHLEATLLGNFLCSHTTPWNSSHIESVDIECSYPQSFHQHVMKSSEFDLLMYDHIYWRDNIFPALMGIRITDGNGIKMRKTPRKIVQNWTKLVLRTPSKMI